MSNILFLQLGAVESVLLHDTSTVESLLGRSVVHPSWSDPFIADYVPSAWPLWTGALLAPITSTDNAGCNITMSSGVCDGVALTYLPASRSFPGLALVAVAPDVAWANILASLTSLELMSDQVDACREGFMTYTDALFATADRLQLPVIGSIDDIKTLVL